MNDVSDNNNGSTGQGFGLGLLIGGLAGISAYYLFGTEEGNRLKKKLVEEFEYANVTIPREISQILEEQGLKQSPSQSPRSSADTSVASVKQSILASLWGTKETQTTVNQPVAPKKKQRNLFHRSTKR